jgi:hypothetical protein
MSSKAPMRPLPGVEAIAFFGSNADAAADEPQAQILCWPTTPAAWHTLTHVWRALRSPDVKRSPLVAASWVSQYAPQVCSVYNDLAALETSVASLITRASMGMAVAVSTVERRASQRELFVDCLLGYQEYLRRQGRATWSAAVMDPGASGPTTEEQFKVATHGIPFAKPPTLHFWDGAIEPIPLELARVAAAACARYVANRNAANPIFDAVRSKLAILPIGMTSSLRGRRR